jgi:hypothetical protein
MKIDHQVQIVTGDSVISLQADALYALLQCYDWLHADGSSPILLTPAQSKALKDCRDIIELALVDLAKTQPHPELPHRRFHTMDS